MDELEFTFVRSSGPGGQNVNKRDTAVRMTHIPTGLAVHVTSERSQAQNRERAISLLRGKLFKLREAAQAAEARGMSVATNTKIEWGSQIRSYVLHPYKQIKDHRTGVEMHDVDAVLENGELDKFIEAEAKL